MRRLVIGLAIGATALMAIYPHTSQARERRQCREYTKTVTIGGQPQQSYGTACLDRNGDWELVSEEKHPRRSRRAPVREKVIIREVERPRHRRHYSHGIDLAPLYFGVLYDHYGHYNDHHRYNHYSNAKRRHHKRGHRVRNHKRGHHAKRYYNHH